MGTGPHPPQVPPGSLTVLGVLLYRACAHTGPGGRGWGAGGRLGGWGIRGLGGRSQVPSTRLLGWCRVCITEATLSPPHQCHHMLQPSLRDGLVRSWGNSSARLSPSHNPATPVTHSEDCEGVGAGKGPRRTDQRRTQEPEGKPELGSWQNFTGSHRNPKRAASMAGTLRAPRSRNAPPGSNPERRLVHACPQHGCLQTRKW